MLKYRTKLNYYDTATISTGAGSAGTRVYSCNGLYDPDITGTGHQPMPFDQLMLTYEHYVCTSALITVSFRNSSTTATMGIGISANASATPTTATQTLIENGVMVRDRLSPYPYPGSQGSLTFHVNVSKFGSVPDLLDNPDYEGSVSANPVEQSYFHISVWNPDSVSAVDCLTEIWIQYFAIFREPRKNSVSLSKQFMSMIIEEEKKGKPKISPIGEPGLAHHDTGKEDREEKKVAVHVDALCVSDDEDYVVPQAGVFSVGEMEFNSRMGAQCCYDIDRMELQVRLADAEVLEQENRTLNEDFLDSLMGAG
jgi:hypothetical protein